MTLLHVLTLSLFLITFRHAYKIGHSYTYEYEASVNKVSLVNSNGTILDADADDDYGKNEQKLKIIIDCISHSISSQVALFNLRYGNVDDDEDFLFEMDLNTGQIVKYHKHIHKHKYNEQEQKGPNEQNKNNHKEALIDLFNLNFNNKQYETQREVNETNICLIKKKFKSLIV